ncbi:hypothetical protein L1049_007953 [Liquidambar formosana]|uniref:YLS9 n=1 Tax=Liquidambar formosana TaxID=63359 RepID=A0AAP0X7Y4_LIQFO
MASSSPNEDQSKTVVGQPVQFSYPPACLPTTHNPYTAPPPAAYYQSDPHSSQPNKTIRCNKSILCGVVIFAFLLLAIITCTSNIAWLVLHPEPPLLQIDSLGISNFNVSQYKLTANWVANFTADNPNDKMRIVLYERDVYVFYKNYYLSWDGRWPDLNLDPKKQGKMSSHLEKIESEHLEIEKQLAQKIGEDRKSGMVAFHGEDGCFRYL